MKFENSNSVLEAVEKYPTLKRTLTLSKNSSKKILGHYAILDDKNKVHCHMFKILTSNGKEMWVSNQDLLAMIRLTKRYMFESISVFV
jgi:hypothetical protein